MKRAVKPMVNGRVLAFMSILAAAVAVLMFGLSYWLASSDMNSGPGFPWVLVKVLLLAFAVMCAVLTIWSTWGAWFWLRLERRRQKAARGLGANIFLASEQPLPRTVPIPATVEIRVKPGAKILIWSVSLLFALVFVAVLVYDYGFLSCRFPLGLLGGLAFVAYFALLFAADWSVEMNDDGLTVCAANTTQTVPWKEARLFAITRGKGATIRYELASPTASAPWMWLRSGTFSARLYEPTIPQYEYDLQMEALLALIAAKTGLPLYDLR
jgi:hypothetical protein